VAEVLPEDQILFFRAGRIIFIDLNIVYALLKFLVVFLLKSVNVEDKKVAVVASNPGEIVMDTAAEQAMTRCFFYSDGLQSLSVVDVQFVTFAS